MANAALGSRSAPSSRVSTLTPFQSMSRWVHFVTQLMSTTHSRAWSARSCSHDHSTGCRTRPSMRSDQRSSGVRGVGPADRTGKSFVTYCPGGVRRRRSSEEIPPPSAPASRRPTNPRVTNRSVISPPSRPRHAGPRVVNCPVRLCPFDVLRGRTNLVLSNRNGPASRSASLQPADGAGGGRLELRQGGFHMQQTPVMQRVVDDAEHEHSHNAVVHQHDHYHVTHKHTGTVLGQFDHLTTYHQHEHNHAPLVHAHVGRDQGDETADHNATAHTHDHDSPTEGGR